MPYVATSAWAKIDRAKTHFNALYEEFQRFVHGHPYEIRQEFDPEFGETAPVRINVVYYPTRSIPTDWSVILGEFFYNLRSALDHVVYDLGPVTFSEFPIFTVKGKFYAMDKKFPWLPAWGS